MEEWSDAENRPLVYPLRESEVLETTTPDDAIISGVFVWPDDPEEKTIVLFELSQREYTALSSAIDVGRDIAFGVDSTRLWWLWIRNMVQVPQICAMMIDCIMNDPDVVQAMVDALGQSQQFVDMISETSLKAPSGQYGGALAGGDCDLSVVAGRAIQVVDVLDGNNTDFLEILEIGTNDEERVSAVLAAIPGLSESPVDEIIDIRQSILEDLSENYAAAVTIGWKNEVSEAIYCLMRESEDCSLTYEQLFTYFKARAGADLNIGSLIRNVVEYVINGDFSTDELVASGMYAIQLGFILTGRDFNGLNIPGIGALMRDASPSSAWEDWDDCPAEWCRSITGADLQSMFTPTGGLGPQAEWMGTGYGANDALIPARITLEGDLIATRAVTSVRIIFSGTNAVGDTNDVTAFTEDFISVLASEEFTADVLLVFSASLQKFEIDVVSSFAPTTVPITVEIIEIQITGTGIAPSFGDEC